MTVPDPVAMFQPPTAACYMLPASSSAFAQTRKSNGIKVTKTAAKCHAYGYERAINEAPASARNFSREIADPGCRSGTPMISTTGWAENVDVPNAFQMLFNQASADVEVGALEGPPHSIAADCALRTLIITARRCAESSCAQTLSRFASGCLASGRANDNQ